VILQLKGGTSYRAQEGHLDGVIHLIRGHGFERQISIATE
jgi:hypothetical protein